jgi:hypothetical protein
VVVGALGSTIVALISPAIRSEVGWGVALGLLIQAPLGWLTIRSIGTDRFQPVWVLGMVVRLAVVALAGLVLVPALDWQIVPILAALVATLLVLLLVEVLTLLWDNSRIKAR